MSDDLDDPPEVERLRHELTAACDAIADLEMRIRDIAATATANARRVPGKPECPASLLAFYVRLEARHTLVGHKDPRLGVDCTECHRHEMLSPLATDGDTA